MFHKQCYKYVWIYIVSKILNDEATIINIMMRNLRIWRIQSNNTLLYNDLVQKGSIYKVFFFRVMILIHLRHFLFSVLSYQIM